MNADDEGTCVSCMVPTDTGLVFEGSAEWIIAGFQCLGIGQQEVFPMMGWSDGLVPEGRIQQAVRVCAECARKTARFQVGLIVRDAFGRRTLPGVVQP